MKYKVLKVVVNSLENRETPEREKVKCNENMCPKERHPYPQGRALERNKEPTQTEVGCWSSQSKISFIYFFTILEFSSFKIYHLLSELQYSIF